MGQEGRKEWLDVVRDEGTAFESRQEVLAYSLRSSSLSFIFDEDRNATHTFNSSKITSIIFLSKAESDTVLKTPLWEE